MKRRSSALSVSAAALLVAAPLLTGCTTDAHPGAAAVVGDQEISVSQVQARVEAVRTAQRAQENAEELLAGSAGITRFAVDYLIFEQLVEHAAEQQGVTVTPREVQQARAMTEQSAGGAEELEQRALAGEGLPATGEQIDEVLRVNLLYQGLAATVDGASEQEVGERLAQLLTDTAEDLGVEVNPRYGEWDAEQVTLVDADVPWLRTDLGEGPDTLEG
ncbi:SurA N-terminal domain-containing protein [Streptomyces sp. ACA25]|uniref:SurA N-terminal domain-containing protein n=1 Tax=Streptomyces sp. ACA25 TaxID=3022596 RepID=UPI002307416D|nr:SurA N-terminal domain-containing protein [Streptomyces sp. ACA25]MDB1087229.1 SurA N-terminal domain-containing protein [Streptomyces sp. ACA25]